MQQKKTMRKFEEREEDSLAALLTFVEDMVTRHDRAVNSGMGARNFSGWERTRHASLYVRAGLRWTEERGIMSSLDLANIVVQPHAEGRGMFRNLLAGMEQIADRSERLLYVESVLSDKVHEALLRRPTYARSHVPGSWFRFPQPIESLPDCCGSPIPEAVELPPRREDRA